MAQARPLPRDGGGAISGRKMRRCWLWLWESAACYHLERSIAKGLSWPRTLP